MAPKTQKKKGGKKVVDDNDDDWEAALNEAAQQQQQEEEGSQAVAPAPPEPEEPAAPAAEEGDAAAAFLASLGTTAAAAGEKKKDAKKKKKPSKAGGNKKDADAEPPAKEQSAQGRKIAEKIAKAQAEKERIERERAEEERQIREEEERLEKEAREAEEKRQEKLRKRAEKRAEAKKAGTYETKKQKEQRLAAERRLKAMQQAGMLPRETNNNAAKSKGDDTTEETKEEPPRNEADDDGGVGAAAREGDDPEAEGEKAPPSPEEDDDDDDDAARPEEEEEEEGPGPEEKNPEDEPSAADEEDGSWEDAADDWEASDPTEMLEKLAQKATTQDEEEDEAERDVAAEKERLRLAGIALREREEKKRLEAEQQARLEAEAKEQEDRVKRELEAKKLAARERRLAREKVNEEARSVDTLRAPICCIMGHVDTGKTKLLDKIRQTNVQDGEAGGITQQIGATYFDKATLVEKIKPVRTWLRQQKESSSLSVIDEILLRDDDDAAAAALAASEDADDDSSSLKLPALMVIDTPGHESFRNLRSRGSNLCDMAIVVVDIMHGLEQQTLESISMLRRKKTPFVVALNKIDRCYDWEAIENAGVRETLEKQKEHTKQEFDQRAQQCFAELNAEGLNVAFYWENTDPKSYVSVIPTSAITGEGVPDLLRVVVSLTQQRLATTLALSATLQCTVLEVKVVEGLGATIDVILVNGSLKEGDTMVLSTRDGPLVTQARTLLTPPPSRETRVKSELIKHESLTAAIGLKITGQGLEKVTPGTSLMVLGPDDDVEDLKEEVMKDVLMTTTMQTEERGVSVQASTLGALEALLEFLKNPGKDRDGKERTPIPVFAASVGPVYKKDIIKASIMAQKGHDEYACVLGFDVAVDPEARAHAEKLGVKIFLADIIYHLENHFTRHLDDVMEAKKADARNVAVFPCLFKISPKHVFNAKDPIVVGGTVVDGILKVGTPLCIPHNGFLDVGVVASIECNHKDVTTAKKGQECAVKIVNDNANLTFGRQFDATHALYSKMSRASIDALKAYFKDDLSDNDWRLVIKLKKVFSII